MSSAVDICSCALIKIGVDSIRSFEDGTAEAKVAARLYPLVRDAMLSAHPWTFATRIEIAETGEPLPRDVVRAFGAFAVGLADGRRIWLRNGEALCAIRVPEEDLAPYFVSALVSRLAAEFCLPLTENGARSERLARLANEELRIAKLMDSGDLKENDT